MEEPVLIEETVQHTRINLLLFDNIRLLEGFHRFYQLRDPLVHFRRLSRKDLLEVVICRSVDLF